MVAQVGTVGVKIDGLGVVHTPQEPTVEVTPGKTYAVLDGEGGFNIERVTDYTARPDRKVGHSVVHTAQSFIDYVLKHGEPFSEVWADAQSSTVVAVIDANTDAPDVAGWGQHRVTLNLKQSLAWKAWVERDHSMLDQLDFANFIEDRLVDVESPSDGELLEIAQSFQAKTKVDFEQGERLATGEVRFKYTEEVTAKAGQKGNITVPDIFSLVIAPYIGGPKYRMRARLRFKAGQSGLKLGFALERPEDILESAFKDVIEAINGTAPVPVEGVAELPHIPQTIFFGTPAW